MEQIAAGIQLDDGEIHADAISYTDDFKKDDVGIEIHSGKNRIVRRIFESLGYKVMKLDRVYFCRFNQERPAPRRMALPHGTRGELPAHGFF